jgi:hypothetical protein
MINKDKVSNFAQRTHFRSTLTDEERLYLLMISKYSRGITRTIMKRLNNNIEENKS